MSKATKRRTRRRRLKAHTKHGENRHDKAVQYMEKQRRLSMER